MATENVIQMQQKTSSGSFDTYYPVGFVGQEVTLTASGWSSSATQAVTVSFPITNIENEELIIPMPKQAYIEAWAQSGIKLLSVTTAGVCTFKYTGTAPEADIQLVVAKAGMTSGGGGVTEEVTITYESIVNDPIITINGLNSQTISEWASSSYNDKTPIMVAKEQISQQGLNGNFMREDHSYGYLTDSNDSYKIIFESKDSLITSSYTGLYSGTDDGNYLLGLYYNIDSINISEIMAEYIAGKGEIALEAIDIENFGLYELNEETIFLYCSSTQTGTANCEFILKDEEASYFAASYLINYDYVITADGALKNITLLMTSDLYSGLESESIQNDYSFYCCFSYGENLFGSAEFKDMIAHPFAVCPMEVGSCDGSIGSIGFAVDLSDLSLEELENYHYNLVCTFILCVK